MMNLIQRTTWYVLILLNFVPIYGDFLIVLHLIGEK